MSAWLDSVLFWVIQGVILIGLLGLIIPIFPGLVVIWLGTLSYGIAKGFSTSGWIWFGVISLLMIVGSLVDNILMGAGARKGGASWWTIGIALMAGLIGTILLPPLGGIILAPLVVFALELWRQRGWREAGKALGGLAVGWGLTFFVRFGLGLLMMICWWVWVWKSQS
ncbi:MAG: DUF456 domain-containing protein [Anaerolineales bacterium]